jgi:hypothetical protein
MDEQQWIKNEMRLYALECLVCQLYALVYQMVPPGASELTQKAWIESARQQTFPGMDSALSDLFSAELEVALDRLVKIQDAYLERVRRPEK